MYLKLEHTYNVVRRTNLIYTYYGHLRKSYTCLSKRQFTIARSLSRNYFKVRARRILYTGSLGSGSLTGSTKFNPDLRSRITQSLESHQT